MSEMEKLSSTKPQYRTMQIADLDPTKDSEAWSAKIDGAHTIIKMEKGKLPSHFSHRISKRTNEPIEYTQKLQHVKTPSEFNAVIRGETYATTRSGTAVHPDVVTALLNSGLEKSIALQKNSNIHTGTALIDVDSFEGKDMRKASYAQKREVLERIAKSNPDYHMPDTAYTPEAKSKLLKSILDKSHHQTKEGLVVHDLSQPDKPFTKAKVIDHHDVYITGIFNEEDVKEGRKPMAGGFTYAWSPSGKTVGKVGTGFKHKEKVEMMKNPDAYIGRVAKVKALDVSKNKVLVKPSFDGWHVEKNLKESSSASAQIEKLAATAWMKYLKGAGKNVEKLKSRAGDLLRESRPTWANPATKHLEQAREDIGKGHISKDVTGYIRKNLSPATKSKLDKPVSQLTKEEIGRRKWRLEEARDGSISRHGLKELAKEKGRTIKEQVKRTRTNIYKDNRPEGHPEEYMNIVHGGEHSKIKHFVNTGNTRNVTENSMATKKTSEPVSREGLMFNSKIKDRAPDYADRHANARLGQPAVLAGRIKKKYLYRNGDSDEYSLPKHLHHKIKDAKIYTPKDKEYHTGDFYSHIKTPKGIKKQAALPGAVPRVMSGLISKKVMTMPPVKPKVSTFAKPKLGGGTIKIAKEMSRMYEFSPEHQAIIDRYHDNGFWEGSKEDENDWRESEDLPVIPGHIHPFMWDGGGNHYALDMRTGEVLSFDHEDHGPSEDHLYTGTGQMLHDFMAEKEDELNDYDSMPSPKPYNSSLKGMAIGAGVGAAAGGLLGHVLAKRYLPGMSEPALTLPASGALAGMIAGSNVGDAIDNAIFNWKHKTASEAIDTEFEKLAISPKLKGAGMLAAGAGLVAGGHMLHVKQKKDLNNRLDALAKADEAADIKRWNEEKQASAYIDKLASASAKKFLLKAGNKLKDFAVKAKENKAFTVKSNNLKDLTAKAKVNKVVGEHVPGVEYNKDAIAKALERASAAKAKAQTQI